MRHAVIDLAEIGLGKKKLRKSEDFSWKTTKFNVL